MALHPTRRALLGLQGEWILEVFVGGSPFRFGTVSVEVTRAGGDSIKFFEGLQPITQALSSEGSADFAVPIEIDAGEEWGAIVGRNNVIERSPAILRRIFAGNTLDEARTVIEGVVEGFAYGAPNERIQFSVVRRARTQSRQLPSPGMVVDETTWPVRAGKDADPSVFGAYYPIVIGAPGTRPGGVPFASTEALLVEINNPDPRILIAGHKVNAATVTIFDYTDPGSIQTATIAVETTVDGVGREISFVDTQGSGLTVNEGRIYYCGWLASGGGLVNPKGGGLLRGAGDVIEWMIQTWTDIRLDASRFGGIRERLTAYKIDTYLNDPSDPMAFLNGSVFPILPIEPRQGEEGLYWYMRRWDATAADAVARLDADAQQIQRASMVTTESEQVVNEVTVSYAPDRGTSRHNFRRIVGAQDQTRPNDEIQAGLVTVDTRMRGGYRAALSQSIFGRQSIEITADAVWDDATATLIGQDIIAEQALPRRFVDYSGGTDLEAFNIGDIVILNDSEVFLFDVVAQILDITVGGPDITLAFELFDDPVVSDRLAS